MNIYRALVALTVAPALTLTQPSLAQSSKPNLNQKLAMYTKPAVVRIMSVCVGKYKWYPEGNPKNPKKTFTYDLSLIGTGFLINPEGYIVTSSKVTESREDCKEGLLRNIKNQIKKESGQDINDAYIENKGKFDMRFDEDGEWEVYLPYSQNNPLLYQNNKPFEVKKSGRDSGKAIKINKDVAIIKVSLRNAPVLRLGDSNQVQIQDQILMVGFPNTADIKLGQELTEESYYEASVQEGRISNPNKQIEGGYPVLLIDIRAAQGSAGSPLINKQGEVVGMLTSNVSDEDAAIPLAIPTSTIQEFIRQSGATNEGGASDEYYRDGLHLYWKGNYEEAKAKFLKVKGLFPFHSEVERLISEIDQIEADRWTKPWKNPTYQLMLALVAGGGVVAAVAYFLLRHKSSARKTSPGSGGVSAEGRAVSTNSYERNGFGGSQSWLELESQGQIRRFQLDKDEHRLGRDPAWSDLEIPTSWEVISRHHAILRKEGEDYRIYDGDGTVPSSNGLWIDDDLRVDSQDGYLLENEDRLKIGKDPHEQVILTYFNSTINQAGVKETKMAD